MTRTRPAELVCTLPNGEVSMPLAPHGGRTPADMVELVAGMITRALAPERRPLAVWSVRPAR